MPCTTWDGIDTIIVAFHSTFPLVLACIMVTDLFDLGFVNFEVNAALLQKQCNNVETVAATLCEGMLSESCIQAVFNKKD